ncbi:uncharacterized protein LOC116213083 [Punica granatum]|uniref:DC1 domain-containing protein n=2 Tax=Punica granatum TaxID=22663 RepID=A0A218WNF9_PUNGR|nr:uncharacterized protein LOC116213083 [Punica granatum]OWM74019.1 hypothetical protein CDL15_Pgr022290 [Punica granatum]PKI59267.1 hypothetical protein CRG98_020347 [Punica granatum]
MDMASAAAGVWVVPRAAGENTKEAKVRHPSHSHPLVKCTVDLDGTGCQECGQPFPPGGVAYGCKDCAYYLHLPCLPAVHTTLHPRHPLTPRYRTDEKDIYSCEICHRLADVTFHCDPCGFHLCEYCMSFAPTCRFEHDGHTFVSFEKGDYEHPVLLRCLPQYACPICGKSGDTKYFRCLSPGCFNYCHFHCIPFDVPKTIKHEYHYHPLTFTESYAEEGRAEHYCDACEEERDPMAPVYRCEECDFTAHTACAISKVLPALIAERDANPSMVPVPFCTDPVLRELDLGIARLLDKAWSLRRALERTVAKLEKTERTCARYSAFMQRDL